MLLFQFLHTFLGFRLYDQGSTSLYSLSRPFLTIRQNSLDVTVCMIARSFYQGYFIHSLSTLHYCNAPSLTTRLTGDYRDRTCTGKCDPASLDAHHINKKQIKFFLASSVFSSFVAFAFFITIKRNISNNIIHQLLLTIYSSYIFLPYL